MAYQISFTVEEVLQELGFNNNTPKRQNCNIIDEVNEDAFGDDKDNFDNQFVKGLILQYECNEDEIKQHPKMIYIYYRYKVVFMISM